MRGEEFEWRVSWTTDGMDWDVAMFASLDVARAHGRRMVSENEGNSRFSIYAERLVVVATNDFLDPDVPGGGVRLAPHMLGTAEEAAESVDGTEGARPYHSRSTSGCQPRGTPAVASMPRSSMPPSAVATADWHHVTPMPTMRATLPHVAPSR